MSHWFDMGGEVLCRDCWMCGLMIAQNDKECCSCLEVELCSLD